MASNQFGFEWSGASAKQVKALDAIITDYFAYKLAAFPALKTLCENCPEFAMAHLLKGYLLLSMGTQDTLPAAKKAASQAASMQENMTDNEREHLMALCAWIAADTKKACHHWDLISIAQPLDVLAIKLQHFTLFWMGRPEHMRDVVSRVMPHWQDDMPGYSHLLGMQAFALEELGQYKRAEQIGRQACELNRDDLWAIHAVAHVYEMQNDLKSGIKWMDQPANSWQDRNPFREHLWWHTALFAFERGAFKQVLDIYDRSIWPATSSFYLDIQNAASLLVRLEFANVDVGHRWKDLSKAAQDRNGDHVLLFTEPHYTMIFGRMGQFDEADKQLASLSALAAGRDDLKSGLITDLTVPICKAIIAYYKKDYASVIDSLMALRYQYQPIGGSHAQRDIFNIFLIEAAIGEGDFALARALLTERTALHQQSDSSWSRLKQVCAALDNVGDNVRG